MQIGDCEEPSSYQEHGSGQPTDNLDGQLKILRSGGTTDASSESGFTPIEETSEAALLADAPELLGKFKFWIIVRMVLIFCLAWAEFCGF
jgi:hypothetical protein